MRWGFLPFSHMRNLAIIHKYPPQANSGGETTIKALFDYLATQGITTDLCLLQPNGQSKIPSLAPYDLVFSHLDRVSFLCNHIGLQTHFYKRVWIYAHNDLEHTPTAKALSHGARIVYNSHWVKQSLMQKYGYPNGLVVYPPTITPAKPKPKGECITLVNCNENKGGQLLIQLAKANPHLQFLGVLGAYGIQIKSREHLPNLRYIENTPNMQDDVWAHTRLLIVPSRYESFGKTAVEALSYDIPVIAYPTLGLCEALGDAATYVQSHHTLDWTVAINTVEPKAQHERYQYLKDTTETQLEMLCELLKQRH